MRPTIFPSVPRLLNKVYEKIVASVNDVRVTRRIAFWQGMVSKQYYYDQCGYVNNKVFDNFVFSKIRSTLGGRIRIMITGSAPIAPNVLSFLRCAFCCPIVEAYG